MTGQNKLSARECQVVARVMTGQSSEEIGVPLLIDRETVKSHIYSARVKLGARSRTELAVFYLLGYVSPDDRARLRETPAVQRFLAKSERFTPEERLVLDAMVKHPEMGDDALAVGLGVNATYVKTRKRSMAGKCGIVVKHKHLSLVILCLIAQEPSGTE